jgi:hypothetical protein
MYSIAICFCNLFFSYRSLIFNSTLSNSTLLFFISGNDIMSKYGGNPDTMEAHQTAWLDPMNEDSPPLCPQDFLNSLMGYSSVTTIPRATHLSEHEEGYDLSVLHSPWPELTTKMVHAILRELSVCVVTWCFEEIAIQYLTPHTCDRLTKNAYESGKRKMERNDSRLQTTQEFLATHLTSTCLRWTAIFCVNTVRSMYRRVTRKVNVNERTDGYTERQLDAIYTFQVLTSHSLNGSMSWLLESSCSTVLVLVLPFKYGGKLHKYSYTLLSVLGFALGDSVMLNKIRATKLGRMLICVN